MHRKKRIFGILKESQSSVKVACQYPMFNERGLQPVSLGICTLLGFILGFLFLVNYDHNAVTVKLISLPGVLWINVLHFAAFPLAFTSLTTAVTSLKRKVLGNIVWQASLYFLGMNFLAAVAGIVLALVFEPGRFTRTMAASEQRMANQSSAPSMRNTAFQESAFIRQDPKHAPDTATERFPLFASFKREEITELSNMRIVGACPAFLSAFLMVTLASIATGYLINNMGKKGRPLAKSLRIINDYLTQESAVLTWFAPIGIGSLLATRVVEMDDMSDLLSRLGTFFAIVSIGLLIHALVTSPLIFFLVTRRHPFAYLSGAKEAIMIASGSGSSFATLPVLVRGVQFHNQVERHVSCFILPLAIRLKPDGSILYQIITVVSIAQSNDTDTSLGIILLVCLAAVVICITTGGTLSSAVLSVVVLQTANIPLRGMEFVFAAAWLTDRLCTAVDVMSTMAGVGIIRSLSRDDSAVHAVQEKRTWPQIEV